MMRAPVRRVWQARMAASWRAAWRQGMMPGSEDTERVGDALRVPVAQLDRAPAF